jgi:hypothetical protein
VLRLSPTKEILKNSPNKGIYLVEKVNNINESMKKNVELNLWSSLSCLKNEERPLNISKIKNESFFSSKRSCLYFDIHRLPNQSILKFGGRKLTREFVPCLKRAYGSGSIFPLNCAEENFCSIDYHHEGGNHHWFIIPNSQRIILENLINKEKNFHCLDHGQLFLDPSILDENNIRYYQTIQHPNEFLVFSSGTLSQCFTEDSSWSESILFALPSWINSLLSLSSCQYHISEHYLSKTIDWNLFRQQFVDKCFISEMNINNNNNNDKCLSSKGVLF